MQSNSDFSALRIADFQNVHRAQDAFIDAFLQGHYSHAYLISGEKGCGKLQLCHLLAAHLLQNNLVDLLCINTQTVNEALGTKAQSSIGVAAIRQMVVPFVSTFSMFQKPRVVIIEQGELLTEQAQNALLKPIEEPQSEVVFFILTQDSSKIITTIKSRCQKVYVHKWDIARVEAYLQRIGVDAVKSNQMAALSYGLVEEAVSLCSDNDKASQLAHILHSLCNVKTQLDAVVFASQNAKIDALLQDEVLDRYEHTISLAIQKASGQFVAQPLPIYWEEDCQYKISSFIVMQGAVAMARQMKNNQINWQACLDYMLANIVEEMKRWH